MKTFLFILCLFFSWQLYSQMNVINSKNVIRHSQAFVICAGKNVKVDTCVYYKSGIYTNLFKSAEGLDSIVTTHVTVKPSVDVSTTIDTNTITVKQENASYQWIDCYNDNLPIASKNQWYTATANGGYAVVVTKEGCSDTSKCIVIDLFDLNDAPNNISVVPSISNGIFMVNALKKMSSIVVVDILGKVVHKNRPTNLRTMVAIKDEPNGIYFLCVASGGKQSIFKIEKQ
jgi:hypothetical protein